jgi:phospholipid/cholesterol/gamma-HCH transport system substrate-binding protein
MPQVTRAQKIRLGAFVAAGLFVLVGGLVLLAGLRLAERRDSYSVRYQEAAVSLSGLEIGAPVKYSGIHVGRVDGVHVDPKDVGVIVVELSLDHGTPVAEDERADLGSQGITGLKYVELTRGSAKARVRSPGEDIPPGASAFDALTTQAGDIAKKVDQVLDRILSLTDDVMKQRIATLLDRTNTLLGTVNGLLEENRESLKTLATSLSATAASADELAANLAGTAKRASNVLDEAARFLRSARATPETLNAALVEVTSTLAESRTLLGSVNTIFQRSRRDITEAITYVRDAAENLKTFAEKVKDDPTLLLRREDDGEDQ